MGPGTGFGGFGGAGPSERGGALHEYYDRRKNLEEEEVMIILLPGFVIILTPRTVLVQSVSYSL